MTSRQCSLFVEIIIRGFGIKNAIFFHSSEPVRSPNSFLSNFWLFRHLTQVMLRICDCVDVSVSPVHVNSCFWYKKCHFSTQMPPRHTQIQFNRTFDCSGRSYRSCYAFVTNRGCWFHWNDRIQDFRHKIRRNLIVFKSKRHYFIPPSISF